MKKFINWILLVLTGKYTLAVEAGICDYSGQGRTNYGT